MSPHGKLSNDQFDFLEGMARGGARARDMLRAIATTEIFSHNEAGHYLQLNQAPVATSSGPTGPQGGAAGPAYGKGNCPPGFCWQSTGCFACKGGGNGGGKKKGGGGNGGSGGGAGGGEWGMIRHLFPLIARGDQSGQTSNSGVPYQAPTQVNPITAATGASPIALIAIAGAAVAAYFLFFRKKKKGQEHHGPQ